MKKMLFIWLIISTSSALAESVATVLSTSNSVKLSRGSVEKPLSRGATLEVGDNIVTSSQASISIKYKNGTLVTIGEQSHYVILAYSPKENEVSISAELKNGKLHSTTTGGSKKQTLKTPVVAMAIFGTEYKVYIPNPARKSFIQVDSGCVVCNNVHLKLGQGYVATSTGIYPAKFPAAGDIANRPFTSVSTNSSSYSGAEITSSVASNVIPSTQTTAAIPPVLQQTTTLIMGLACATSTT